jgi:hypothetical protein
VKEKEPSPEGKPRARARSRKKADLDGNDQKFFDEGEAMNDGERSTLHSDVRDADGDLRPAGLGGGDLQRRGAFLRYVGIAVGVCAVLCLFAAVRFAVTRTNTEEAPATAASAPATTTAAPASAGSAPAAALASAPAPEGAGAAPAASALASASPPAASAAPSPSAATEAPPEPGAPQKSAKEEREDARRALEKGKIQEAILAALRSTALDPEDADAWLLLGGAYQSAGKSADARTAYASCAKEAKRGEVRECRLMLR